MNGKKILAILICMISFSAVSAEITGKMIGGEPVMSWEDGGQDFFVMFNSNIDDQITLLDDDPDNPQGDTCLNESVFTLTDFHIPEDAIIEEAYLIWMGAVDPEKLDEPTDNSVKLKFTQSSENPVSYEQVVTVGETGKLLTDENSFEFESLKFTADVTAGCSETELGIAIPDQELGYFTYRADVTDFFAKIGDKFYGDYTLSDLDCTEHDFYRCKTTMVSSWAVFIVYRSKSIRQKNIYFYNGLSFVQGDKSIANVSGFNLPKFSVTRLTTMIAGGDPEPAIDDLPVEGILLQGEGASFKFRFYNECNPLMETFVEVFNSVSSIAHWSPEVEEADKIQCISAMDGSDLNYGIDVDTFYIDSETNINLQEQFRKGNTSMEITLSVNQDAVFTNFMVLSVDSKNAKFDIPPEASDTTKSDFNFPYDREKHFCACPSNDDGKEPDYYCETVTSAREFYYFIKVQNWGDEDIEGAEGIVVYDELDKQLEYIPGTTEMATSYFAEMDAYDNWMVIPDKADNVFPLSGAGYKVSSKMVNCDESDWSCTDSVLIRYKVKPKVGTAKDYIFENTALFRDGKSEDLYKTNRSYPLRLKPTKCVVDTECPSPTAEMCGRRNYCMCKYNPDVCTDGLVCDGCNCVESPVPGCINSNADVGIGKNAPQSDGAAIVIPKDNDGEPLIVGQFTLMVGNCDADMYFNFNSAVFHINTDNDSKISFNELELIYDVNGNGQFDGGEEIIAISSVTTNYVKFHVNYNMRKFHGKSLHYFLIRTKVDYNDPEIPRDTTFFFYIESEKSIEISDSGNATVSPNEIEFAKFMLEPTGDFFIFTTGPENPQIPPFYEINNNIPVLQLRTKAVTKANGITKLEIKIPVDSDYVKFGEENGIDGVSLWIDNDKDGVGNVKIAEMTGFNAITNSVIFEDFIQPLTYLKGEEKILVINVDFNMINPGQCDEPMMGRIEIPSGGIKVSESSTTVVELPVRSKKVVYEEDWEDWEDCDELPVEEEDDDRIIPCCGCSFIL